VGANAEEVAKVAVQGAIEAAGSVGTTATKAVKEILIGVVEGVRAVAAAAFPANGSAARDARPTPDDTQPKTSERDARGRFK
jgi:hypothetical protein